MDFVTAFGIVPDVSATFGLTMDALPPDSVVMHTSGYTDTNCPAYPPDEVLPIHLSERVVGRQIPYSKVEVVLVADDVMVAETWHHPQEELTRQPQAVR